jgi:hypothetical protein
MSALLEVRGLTVELPTANVPPPFRRFASSPAKKLPANTPPAASWSNVFSTSAQKRRPPKAPEASLVVNPFERTSLERKPRR